MLLGLLLLLDQTPNHWFSFPSTKERHGALIFLDYHLLFLKITKLKVLLSHYVLKPQKYSGTRIYLERSPFIREVVNHTQAWQKEDYGAMLHTKYFKLFNVANSQSSQWVHH